MEREHREEREVDNHVEEDEITEDLLAVEDAALHMTVLCAPNLRHPWHLLDQLQPSGRWRQLWNPI